MNLKNILVVFLFSSLFFYYTIVNSWFYKSVDVDFYKISSKNIYIDSEKLNNVIVIFKSVDDISKYKINSSCYINTEFLYKKDNYNFFSLSVLDKNCSNENFYLKDEKENVLTNTHFKLNLIKDFDLYNKLTDYNDFYLQKANKKFLLEKDKFKLFASIDNTNTNFEFLEKSRYYDEVDYNNSKVEEVIFKRLNKYLIPVEWYKLPDGKNPSKLPNSARPYRASYTDWVHEWWDIDAPLGQEVISIDDWIIVKVVRDFKFEDLKKVKYSEELTIQEKQKNLDILRWNQVWVKTMKWDVIFYGHLDKVYENIKVWDTIYKWQTLWQVWVSWVPDKNYTDYHLHFELRKNPYLSANAWNNSEYDYMNWERYFAGETSEFILKNQYNIFQ